MIYIGIPVICTTTMVYPCGTPTLGTHWHPLAPLGTQWINRPVLLICKSLIYIYLPTYLSQLLSQLEVNMPETDRLLWGILALGIMIWVKNWGARGESQNNFVSSA